MPSYKVWREGSPDDVRIMHLWEWKNRGDLKMEAGKRFWPETPAVGDIQVEKIGKSR